MTIKDLIRPLVPGRIRELRNLLDRAGPLYRRHCPICGYHGFFTNDGRPIRIDARCPKCRSLERHRLFWLWFKEHQAQLKEPVLHFAAALVLQRKLRARFTDYTTADLFRPADLRLNIEAIDLPDGSLNTVICNHVLEHVDDMQALSELHRILADDGRLVVSVPIVEGWDHTYENPDITDPLLREVHFGQNDHVRFYGRDFRDRLRDAGFTDIDEVTAMGPAVIEYGLDRGEKFFVCRKH